MVIGRFRVLGAATVALASVFVFGFLIASAPVQPVSAEPPADQEYTGNKRCASCHFEQYMKWKGTGHAKAFALLTKKYEKDAKCLECHTTGYGQKTGYTNAKDTAALQGVGCEVCHGPGSKHEEAAKPFAQVKELSKEDQEKINGTIWRILPENVCLGCHKVQGHGDSSTPKGMKKK